jgi:hypothetical protein
MAERNKIFSLPRNIGLILSLLVLAACQPKVPQYTDLDSTQGRMNWSRFMALSVRNTLRFAPFSATLTIRCQTPDKGYRFDAFLWSNLADSTPYPVRLDILGAFGAAKVKIFEDQHTFLLYDLENNSAYTAAGSPEAMLRAGIPMPLRLGELVRLLNGHYRDFFLSGQNSPTPQLTASNDRLESTYHIPSGPLQGELSINSQGQPLTWTELKDPGWRFEFSYLEGVEAFTLPGPRRVRLIHPAGYTVTIQVKTLIRLTKPFTPEQLDLILPDTATIRQS